MLRNTYNVRVDNIKGILMILTDLILEGDRGSRRNVGVSLTSLFHKVARRPSFLGKMHNNWNKESRSLYPVLGEREGK